MYVEVMELHIAWCVWVLFYVYSLLINNHLFDSTILILIINTGVINKTNMAIPMQGAVTGWLMAAGEATANQVKQSRLACVRILRVTSSSILVPRHWRNL